MIVPNCPHHIVQRGHTRKAVFLCGADYERKNRSVPVFSHPVGSQYGNLKERIDSNKGLTETFGYDGLSRLTSSVVTGQPSVTVSYDSFGNIKQKTDIGAYSYGVTAGPHALTNVAGLVLTYDQNGNNTGIVGGRQITYNTFDKPTLISRSGYTSSFTYGPDRDYYKRVEGPSGTKTIYLDGVEKVYKADGSYDVRRYVPGGALITQKYNSSNALQSTSKELMLKDHLGSTDVIADSTGVLKQAMSFDSWGRRRDAGNWSAIASTVGFDVSRTAQGYTGHEMLDDVDVVHMHGRIYDARWGRMLQADPFIQDKSDSQAFNRFAYVINNPLIYTDPSGYCVETVEYFKNGSTITHRPDCGPPEYHLDLRPGFVNGGGRSNSNNRANDRVAIAGILVGGENLVPNSGLGGDGGGTSELSTEISEITLDGVDLSAVNELGLEDFTDDRSLNGVVGSRLSFTSGKTYAGTSPAIYCPVLPCVTGGGGGGGGGGGKIGRPGGSGGGASVAKGANNAPDYIVSPGGTAFPVPKGATGPTPVVNPAGNQTGTAFTGGTGGANGQVSTMRIMNPTPARGRSPGYPNGYIKYENSALPKPQGVDPYSGNTLPNSQSHFPIE